METIEQKRLLVLDHIDRRGRTPKKFRVWDELHHRWFQGGISKEQRDHGTDAINYFGEVMILEGTMFDQNEDDTWKNSPEIKRGIDKLDYLYVVQSTGAFDIQGNELYEGDIVITESDILGYIVYDNQMQSYVVDSPDFGVQHAVNLNDCILKGNIFQHYTQWFSEEE